MVTSELQDGHLVLRHRVTLLRQFIGYTFFVGVPRLRHCKLILGLIFLIEFLLFSCFTTMVVKQENMRNSTRKHQFEVSFRATEFALHKLSLRLSYLARMITIASTMSCLSKTTLANSLILFPIHTPKL